MKKRTLLSAAALAAVLSSCGVSQSQLDKATERLDKLAGSGLPDSLLSEAKAELYDAKEAQKDSKASEARGAYKRAIAAMKNAESVLAKSLTEKKPQLTEKLASLKSSAQGELKGLHLEAMNTSLDSIAKLLEKDRIIEAEYQAGKADSLFGDLKTQQTKAESLRAAVTGTWVFSTVQKSTVDPTVNANLEKKFALFGDGKAVFTEQKIGKSSDILKEDWRFESYGTWDLKGDTIKIKTARFACVKYNFEELHSGKWEKKTNPTYDSTITDGSQDRYIVHADLIQDFKKQ